MKNGRLSESTLDHLLEGFQLISFKWEYLYVNRTAVKQNKVSKEQLLGHTIMEVYPGIEQSDFFQTLKRCMEERTHAQIENFFTFPDQSTAWFDLHIEAVPEGVFILSIDITTRKTAERNLAYMNTRLEKLVQLRTLELQAKNKQVMDSLFYARHIQRAFLSTLSHLEEAFADSF